MLPNPLHPAVVHFPVVLAFLLPLFAFGALWAIRRGVAPMRAWAVPIAATAMLAASAVLSVKTGEAQEDTVENVVAEQPFETHEEAGEALMIASVALLVLMGAGLAPGRVGGGARVAAGIAAIAVMAGAAWVGRTGGELVYTYGAASAYTNPLRQVESSAGIVEGRERPERDR